jgi:hypothetical protein
MECSRDGRREYGKGAHGSGGARCRRAAQAESVPQLRVGAHNTERHKRRGLVDEDEPRGLDRKSCERHRRVDEDEPRPDKKSHDGCPSHIIINVHLPPNNSLASQHPTSVFFPIARCQIHHT